MPPGARDGAGAGVGSSALLRREPPRELPRNESIRGLLTGELCTLRELTELWRRPPLP
eukprot:gene49999-45045_t